MDSYLPATDGSILLAEETQDPAKKVSILCGVLHDPSSSLFTLSIKELAIVNLTEQFMKKNRAVDLCSLLTHLRFFFSLIPTKQTAKVMRRVIDSVGEIPGSSDLQIIICKEMVQWTRAERRSFPRQRLEARLAALLVKNKEYSEALAVLNGLIKEVRRIDDKLLLVEIHLLESKLHITLGNLPKAKVALTAARTAANAVYVPQDQEGAIELQNGILHAEEKNYITAHSYFSDAFGCFCSLQDPEPGAQLSLKYFLLCKIMVGQAHLVDGILSMLFFSIGPVPPALAVMKHAADAACRLSLESFKIVFQNFKPQLEEDPFVHRHLLFLYGHLLEHNLCRLIEPFSRVEIAHVSELIGLPVHHVERKLSQMILDKKLAGTLDQPGCLVIFDDPKTDALYSLTLQTISNIGKVVDSLYARSAKIIA
ncbi:26S proteasome non-ATPase regulatory subunit 11 homolog [Vigna radiata var. radiata]|uniref:26S proteasome non-ATPase regulatory subunit 11 homolog n=1 Tax=Vigna radiata var. radiata TaxID=3916 RepID=A0A1S3UE36_VIGRR|nr:26S proteasome non-ATPase regulatory subunit 11 homolog [Vigna radiata var. radiata]